MISDPRSVTFHLPVSCRSAVAQVKRALEKDGLRVPAEMNVASHIREEFGATLTPSFVLYVDDPALLLEAVIYQRDAAMLIPQPVSISGNGHASEIVLRSAEALRDMGMPPVVRDSVLELHSRIVRAMDSIGEREALPQIAQC
ncbi:MAG: hypothetical protein IT169_03150 [Bryobacterales bacterium]|nr:hypothetical protein [Bryobacterales bacterium]MCC7341881.1 hypothetical protein [Bryobacterales bacterium]